MKHDGTELTILFKDFLRSHHINVLGVPEKLNRFLFKIFLAITKPNLLKFYTQ